MRSHAQSQRFLSFSVLVCLVLMAGGTEPCHGEGPKPEHSGLPRPMTAEATGLPKAKSADATVRIGTFNIRMFPCNDNCDCIKLHGYRRWRCKREEQPTTDWRRLGDTITRLRPDILGVNEILNPERLARFAVEHLGPDWRFAHAEEGERQKVGFLYNSSVVRLRQRKIYSDIFTRLRREEHHQDCVKRNLRPAFACRFEVIGTKFDLYVVVLHLKSKEECRSLRRAQWKLMERFVDELAREDQDIVIVGDFNEYSRGDRDFDDFCRAKNFTHVSEAIACTHMHRDHGSPLDNILVSESALKVYQKGSAQVGGPCAEGCTPTEFRKAYMNRVSDHCPVVAEFRTQVP